MSSDVLEENPLNKTRLNNAGQQSRGDMIVSLHHWCASSPPKMMLCFTEAETSGEEGKSGWQSVFLYFTTKARFKIHNAVSKTKGTNGRRTVTPNLD